MKILSVYTPKISIVTPSYNQGQYIRETVESVLNQSYTNLEYWVIDGNSTDNTVKILKEYEDDHRFHWISERDKGQSDAINKGLARCTGDIFVWLNSDDVLLPNALHTVTSAWIKMKTPTIVYGLARHINEEGNDLGLCPAQSTKMTLHKILSCRSILVQPATFAPTDYVKSVGGVDLNLHYAMDLDLWIKLAELLPLHYVSEELALYRLHTQSKTVALSTKWSAEIETVLMRAVQRGLISEQQAKVHCKLFDARVSLMPEVNDFYSAIVNIRYAIRTDPTASLQALFILLKAAMRSVVTPNIWSNIRSLRTKLSA